MCSNYSASASLTGHNAPTNSARQGQDGTETQGEHRVRRDRRAGTWNRQLWSSASSRCELVADAIESMVAELVDTVVGPFGLPWSTRSNWGHRGAARAGQPTGFRAVVSTPSAQYRAGRGGVPLPGSWSARQSAPLRRVRSVVVAGRHAVALCPTCQRPSMRSKGLGWQDEVDVVRTAVVVLSICVRRVLFDHPNCSQRRDRQTSPPPVAPPTASPRRSSPMGPASQTGRKARRYDSIRELCAFDGSSTGATAGLCPPSSGRADRGASRRAISACTRRYMITA